LSTHKIKLQYGFRLYLNNPGGKRVLGNGGAQILEAIDKHGSIVAAAEELGMSYKFMWDYLSKTRKRLKQPIIMTRRGGTPRKKEKGGGATTLTPAARTLLKEFRSTEALIANILSKKKVNSIAPKVSITNKFKR
jgi:molybdate transport system regulatory protein